MSNNSEILKDLINKRILVLDGAMGTMIQRLKPSEEDYRGERFRDSSIPMKGNNDILVLTMPQAVENIHREYLEAGADIVETNTFNANTISQADYGTENLVYEINLKAAQIAKRAVDDFNARDGKITRFAAGSVGPTNKTASLAGTDGPAYLRRAYFDDFTAAYLPQIEGLYDGGVDLIQIETSTDTVNVKAALKACDIIAEKKGRRLPVIVSVTVVDMSGRMLAGQTLKAFLIAVRNRKDILAVGLNCSFGADRLTPFLEELSAEACTAVCFYPNAGLPNEFGGYDDTPQNMASYIKRFASKGLLNIVGGCCGTDPSFIKAIADTVKDFKPRVIPDRTPRFELSGLDPFVYRKDMNFINIGERTNSAGSRKFARLIAEGDFEGAAMIAREQADNGAQIIDVNTDDAMNDSAELMTKFLNALASDPETARLPIQIDSSDRRTVTAGLKCLQGKGIVNSISLKDGKEIFLDRASEAFAFGAAVIVSAFDEKGQADTTARKIEILERSIKLLVEAGFPAEDIILDPNVLAIGTGLSEHDNYAVDFIDTVKYFKKNYPDIKITGGISNLSFAFRGNDRIRKAINSVFLYSAIRAGLDMGIVNPGQIDIYDEIPRDLLELVEDLVFNRKPNSSGALLEFAASMTETVADNELSPNEPLLTPGERLIESVVKGSAMTVEEDLTALLSSGIKPIEIIEGALSDGMAKVGELFGSGKMFLPQVVKSAGILKKCTGFLEPYFDRSESRGKKNGKIVLATVKGDVHDIGKNIVGVVLSCNNIEVIDLGVMTPASRIIEEAVRESADMIGLSGLITPSLDEMINVVSTAEKSGLKIPILIGGATTSKLHTAVKIAPAYSHSVVHVSDASQSIGVVNSMLDPSLKDEFAHRISTEYKAVADSYSERSRKSKNIALETARARKREFDPAEALITKPKRPGVTVLESIPVGELVKLINKTEYLLAWGIKSAYPQVLESEKYGTEAVKLLDTLDYLTGLLESRKEIKFSAAVGIFPAYSEGDDVVAIVNETPRKFNFLRQTIEKPSGVNLCLSDFIAPEGLNDYIGMFVGSAGFGSERLEKELASDDYLSVSFGFLLDRMAEAIAEYVHRETRKNLWGYDASDYSTEELIREKYRGIRPAPGYPALPDHALKADIFDALSAEKVVGTRLTESYMMLPVSSVCGLIFAHPKASYFAVGRISDEQAAEYAQRRSLSGLPAPLLANFA